VNVDPPIQNFSTRNLSKGARFDCWMHILQDSLWQVTDWRDVPDDFNVDLKTARFGGLTTIAERMTAHHSLRTKSDVERSSERSCHIFLGLKQPWAFTHMGRHERLEQGDVVIMGEGTHETHVPTGFEGIIIKCPESWMKTWLPEPSAIAGRAIRRDTAWGAVLSPMLSQLTPEFVVNAPLPKPVLVDQLGAVLALVAGTDKDRGMRDTLDRVRKCIRERCSDQGLTANDVASALNIPTRALHQALRTGQTAFGTELVRARAEVAVHLLSTTKDRRTLNEIAQKAGFSNMSHFSRVVRLHTGVSPLAILRP